MIIIPGQSDTYLHLHTRGVHGEKKQRVLTALSAFFEKFFGLGSTGDSDG